MSKTLGELILIDPVDIPDKQKILDAAARLQKDYEIMASYTTKKTEADAYVAVAAFLNFLAEKVKK